MTSNLGDIDTLLSYLDEIEEIIQKARLRIAPKQSTVEAIDWRVKGGKLATPDSPFCYAWVHLRDSDEVKEEVEDLVKSIWQSYGGAVTLDGFIYSLSPDGRILRRARV